MLLAIAIHLLAAIVWIGGMFFAYMVLRPSAAALLEPPQRLPLWCACFKRFFSWVWLCVAILPASGYWMVFETFGGFASGGWHIKTMHLSGLLMIALFLYLYVFPYRNLKREVDKKNYPAAAEALARIRTIVGTNLIIGLFTASIAVAGRHI